MRGDYYGNRWPRWSGYSVNYAWSHKTTICYLYPATDTNCRSGSCSTDSNTYCVGPYSDSFSADTNASPSVANAGPPDTYANTTDTNTVHINADTTNSNTSTANVNTYPTNAYYTTNTNNAYPS